MTKKIENKIVGCEVVKEGEPKTGVQQEAVLLERDAAMEGATYKIKTHHSEHSMYVTINDVVVGKGTDSEHRRPFEIFINTKNMEHFMWIVTLTRILSAIFRQGGDVAFLVEELKSVFDPRGGHYKKGGAFMPSIVAEIGDVIEQHFLKIGFIEGKLKNKELIEKRKEAEEKLGGDFTGKGEQCPTCTDFSLVRLDGCNVCLSCGHSTC